MQLALPKNSSNDEHGYAVACYNFPDITLLSRRAWLCTLLGWSSTSESAVLTEEVLWKESLYLLCPFFNLFQNSLQMASNQLEYYISYAEVVLIKTLLKNYSFWKKEDAWPFISG